MTENSRVRVTMVGVVIVALFVSLVARLWFLQMGPEQNLRARAIALSTRTIQTESPRGRILDRNGKVLAEDVAAWAVTVDRNMKKATLTRVLGQLAELLSQPESALRAAYNSPRQSPLLPAVVALNVSIDERLAILQRRDDYPGVNVAQLTVRKYPEAERLNDPTLAAQVLGYVGEIDSAQLKKLKAKGYQAGDLIGRDGVESAYESELRGPPEIENLQVDPAGRQIGAPTVVQPGSRGDDVKLTLDVDIQHAAETALQNGINAARTLKDVTVTDHYATLKATGGAVVVLDAHSGAVVAMASNPAFPPAFWVGGVSQANFAGLTDPANHFPLINRATEGQYAPGSTFKLVTSLAENRFGIRNYAQYVNAPASVVIGNQTFTNDNNVGNGSVNLTQALTVSSDTYFYTVGNEFWLSWQHGDYTQGLGLQQQARDMGFDAKTGVELDELSGRVPDPIWKQKFANANYKNATDRQQNGAWYPGDEVHLAVGQGDTVVTPLQLADAYAQFANGGTLPTPHVASEVVAPSGKAVQLVAPKPRASTTFDPNVYASMLAGFEGVTQNPKGTAYAAFQGFPFGLVPGGVAGKTGTAQVQGKGDTSLFASFFPAAAPQYVVVAVVEEGGHGAQIAAPIVRNVIESIEHLPVTPIAGNIAGNSGN
jgi:penicillin-binding protein 2